MEGVHDGFSLSQECFELLKRLVDNELNDMIKATRVLVAELIFDGVDEIAAVVCRAMPRNAGCNNNRSKVDEKFKTSYAGRLGSASRI